MINIIFRSDWANSVRASFECAIIQWRKAQEKQQPIEIRPINLNIVQSAEVWCTQKPFLLLIVLHFFGHICCHIRVSSRCHWTLDNKKKWGKKTNLQNKINFLILFMCIFMPQIEHIEFGLWICVCVPFANIIQIVYDHFKSIPNMDNNVNTIGSKKYSFFSAWNT